MNKLIKAIVLVAIVSVSAFSAPIQFVAHAGNGSTAPSHSIPSYQDAIKYHADILKLDLHPTSDGVIVLQHDPTLKRRMKLDFKIKEHTYQEILDKATYIPKGGHDKEKIVRLEQALDLVKDTPMNLWLDFKTFTPEMAEKVLSIVHEHGFGNERLMIATFSTPALSYFKQNHPDIRRVLHVGITGKEDGVIFSYRSSQNIFKLEEVVDELKREAKQLQLYGFNYPIISPAFNRENISKLQDSGLWISVYFAQDVERAHKAVQVGANAIVSDYLQIAGPIIRAEEAKLAEAKAEEAKAPKDAK